MSDGCLLAAFSHGGEKDYLCHIFYNKGTNSIYEGSTLMTSQMLHLQIPSLYRLRFQHINLGRGAQTFSS